MTVNHAKMDTTVLRSLNGNWSVCQGTTVLQVVKSKLFVQLGHIVLLELLSTPPVLRASSVMLLDSSSMKIVRLGFTVMGSMPQAVLLVLVLLATQSANLMKQPVSSAKEESTLLYKAQSVVSLVLLVTSAMEELTPTLLLISSNISAKSVLLDITVPKDLGKSSPVL